MLPDTMRAAKRRAGTVCHTGKAPAFRANAGGENPMKMGRLCPRSRFTLRETRAPGKGTPLPELGGSTGAAIPLGHNVGCTFWDEIVAHYRVSALVDFVIGFFSEKSRRLRRAKEYTKRGLQRKICCVHVANHVPMTRCNIDYMMEV